MRLEYVPLLQIQRDLYQMPRGLDRFHEYLRTMIDAGTGDLKYPLVAMNPMGKDHLAPFLDKLLEMQADEIAAAAVAEAAAELRNESGAYRVCLVVSDDLHGGWTNRYFSEFGYRFGQRSFAKRGWIAGTLWTSESYAPAQVREETLLCVFRTAYVQTYGQAHTLGEMLDQERHAMRKAGVSGANLEPDDLTYTREILAPHLASTDWPTQIAALFGDEAARQLGYLPLGLSPRAGLALALAEAQSRCAAEVIAAR